MFQTGSPCQLDSTFPAEVFEQVLRDVIHCIDLSRARSGSYELQGYLHDCFHTDIAAAYLICPIVDVERIEG